MITEQTFYDAALVGDYDQLKYLMESHYTNVNATNKDFFHWSNKITEFAAEGGHVKCLQLAHELGCEWCITTYEAAATGGHLECIKYAYEHGCPHDKDGDTLICGNAAEGGYLDCLMYLHKNGFHWSHWTCSRAAEFGHIECLKYAHENGCPISHTTYQYTKYSIHKECLEYICSKGYDGDYWKRYIEEKMKPRSKSKNKKERKSAEKFANFGLFCSLILNNPYPK